MSSSSSSESLSRPSLRHRLFARQPATTSDHSAPTSSATLHMDAPTHRRRPFYRRMAPSRSPDDSPRKAPYRPSLFSRVVHRVVPCVSADPDLVASDLPHTDQPPADIHMQQLPAPAPEPSPQPPATPPVDIVIADLPLALPIHVPIPPSPTDSQVIVPPPPNTLLLPQDETDGVTSGAVQPPGSVADIPLTRTLTRDSDDSDGTYSDEEDEAAQRRMLIELDEQDDLVRRGGSGIPIGPDGQPKPLLPPILPEHVGRKCLVLDLDETLVHSSFKAVQDAHFIVPVEIEYHMHHFHVLKRPGVDDFLKKMGDIYEVVVFTASLSKYADPVLDKLDIHRVVAHRLFRESCFSYKGNYVKDLSQLGRPIADTIILDNSPASYIFHPSNAVPVSSWFNDPHDAELTDLIPFLADLTDVGDVRGILDGAR
ncbi:hypothetical protein H0H81_011627 [Sphagnurus paluster]|uniref:protein-serine/threonine phosphatase n=1 Tax=Sphagnurus paluster TaxID=117069 RepID=A0A9P7KHI2_9AGAR|nr:hypothetical protein H0H81_011627 [Sphagnurus paluster]